MGLHLVQVLKQRQVEIVVTSRRAHRVEGNIKYIQGDAKDPEFLADILRESWDAIVDFMVYSTEQFRERYNLFLAVTKQYFFISSARVYAEVQGAITEDSPRLLDVSTDQKFLATDEYSLAKARQEDILKNSGRRNWTIIRPYITYAENRLQLGVLEKEAWLYRALQGRSIIFPQEMLAKKTTMTYGEDVATTIAALVGRDDAIGESFHITENGAVTWGDVLAIYLAGLEKKLGKRPEMKMVSLGEFEHCHPATYQICYDRLFDRIFDNSKIHSFVSTSKFRQTAIALPECLERFLVNPQFERVSWRLEARKDRVTGESVSFNEISGLKQKIAYFTVRYLLT